MTVHVSVRLLSNLAAEIDRNRIDLHVPGAAPAIVRGLRASVPKP